MSKNKFVDIEKFNKWFEKVEKLSPSDSIAQVWLEEKYQPRWIKYWQKGLTPEQAIFENKKFRF